MIMVWAGILGVVAYSNGHGVALPSELLEFYNISQDTFPLKPRYGDFINDQSYNPFDITPSLIEQKVEYDPQTGNYIIYEKIGDEYFRTPSYMTFQEYMQWRSKQEERDNFSRLAGISTGKKTGIELADPMQKIDIQKNMIDRLFGGSEVNIQPQGNIDLTFGLDYYRNENPNLPLRQQSPGVLFDFDMNIEMGVDGNIGKKLNLGFNYDTRATFDFDRQIKLEYDSEQFSEDDIIKKIEAGNVSLPLRSNLIQGNQNLFGLKTELQFGKLRLTAIASQQRSQRNNIRIENGASIQTFEIRPDEYDENRHFFLSHHNRDTYESNLETLPFIRSAFRISRLEIWISEDRADYQPGTRIIAAVSDLAEANRDKYTNTNANYNPPMIQDPLLVGLNGLPLADNRSNPLYQELIADADINDIDKAATLLRSRYNMIQTRDFEVYRGRKLNPTEYTYNEQLGFISLNLRLRPNQVLGVAYQYYYTANCDEIYQVGDMSNEGEGNTATASMEVASPKLSFVKMLKSTNQRVDLSTWDLMMKNVYPLNSTQITREDFEFDIFFEDDKDGSLKKFLPFGDLRYRQLLEVFNLDRLNVMMDPQPDGIFDFVPGVTVIPRTGTMVFPVLEPFGRSLVDLIGDPHLADSLNYNALYDTTLIGAREQLERNKFVMRTRVKSGFSGEVQLGPFVPQGSVRVTAGGRTLIENQDYEIDYSLGRLRIINPAYLQQGTPVNVSFEDNALFSLQQKTMLGLRADYEVSKKLSLGATYLRLFERPFTQKVNLGDDPINNRVFGFDMNYSTESKFLTKAVDRLPFISTKEPSFLNFSAEVAALKPGHSKAINLSDDNSGVVSIDDFEGAFTGLLLGSTRTNDWVLSSCPSDRPESDIPDLVSGANRALLNWYVIDISALNNPVDRSNSYTRLIQQDELFDRDVQIGLSNLFTFDLSYYPKERGPYNFDLPGGTAYSAGLSLNADGTDIVLNNPESRWGGIMRYFPNTDFEAANYESIEFWMLNPFMERSDGEQHIPGEVGKMIFHLGSVSEDVLKDNLQFFENSIPVDETSAPNTLRSTPWGRVSNVVPIVDAFDIQRGSVQDVGFDGMNDEMERQHYMEWLNTVGAAFPVPQKVFQDPSNDNYLFFNDRQFTDEDLLTRYKQFNGPEGNAPLSGQNEDQDQRLRGNPRPDKEDLNNNKSLDLAENYFQYEVDIINAGGEVDVSGSSFIREVRQITNPQNGNIEKWYRVRIPLRDGQRVNEIEGFRAIQFMRMVLTGFSSAKTFRMAEFQLRRNQWRLYPSRCFSDVNPDFEFVIDDVGVEENSSKRPFNYITPRGIKQERVFNTFSNLLQDEKSMSMNFCGMAEKCEASMYKLTQLDLTFYKRLQMFVHAARDPDDPSLDDHEVSVFIRLGKDFENNYYEYEMPLVLSDESLGIRDQDNIWRDTNFINVAFEHLTELKLLRNNAGIAVTDLFEAADPERPHARRKIKGNPSIGYIKVIQIGVRNIDPESPPSGHCGEIWVNELRAAGLEQRGGYAGLARLQMQLADLGEMNFSGSYSSIGWGAIDQKIQDRAREEIFQYDLSTNLELGKFFPNSFGLSIPMYAQYSKWISRPLYDPLQQDLTIDQAKLLVDTQEERDEVEDRALETTTVKALNFTNVKKTPTGGSPPKPWSIENVSVTYAYSETVNTDPIIRENKMTETNMGLDYNYNSQPKYWEPFKNVKVGALRLLKEFNFNFKPNSVSFSADVKRFRGNRTFRFPDEPVFTFDNNRFMFDRRYRVKWDFTKALKFDYTANASSIVDELRQVGIADNPNDRPWVDETGQDFTELVRQDPGTVRQYWWDNFRNLGRAKGFDQRITLSYTLPIRYLPMMDWVTVRADYAADYSWQAGSLIIIDAFGNGPGNIIQNNQTRTVNATFDFKRLYNKSKYLQSIEGKPSGPAARQIERRTRGGTQEAAPQRSGEEDKEKTGPSIIEKVLIRPLMSLRDIRFNYREDLSTLLPGFNMEPRFFGLSPGFEAPGLGFVLGMQPDLNPNDRNNWLFRAANRGWMNTSPVLNDQISQFQSHNIDAKITLEPFKSFEITVDFVKKYRRTHTEVFKNKNTTGEIEFMQLAGFDMGGFEESYLSLKTLFGRPPELLYSIFKENRRVISNRLPNIPDPPEHATDPGYSRGYGERHYDVIVPAFLAAYQGDDVNTVDFDLEGKMSNRLRIPAPNWSLRYDGLRNLPWFRDFLSGFNLTHGYRSTLRVNHFNSIPNFSALNPFDALDRANNYYTRIEIPQLSIIEAFAPLVGVNFRTKSDLNIDFQYKKGRQLDLSLQTDLREQRNTELVFGFGYTIRDFKGFGGGRADRGQRTRPGQEPQQQQQQRGRVTSTRGRTLKINLDFSVRDNISYVFNFLDTSDIPEPERGVKEISLNPNVDYDMTDNLTLRFFVQYRRSEPKTSLSFNTTNVNGGVTLRFKLN